LHAVHASGLNDDDGDDGSDDNSNNSDSVNNRRACVDFHNRGSACDDLHDHANHQSIGGLFGRRKRVV
jgi:hypothetical protein